MLRVYSTFDVLMYTNIQSILRKKKVMKLEIYTYPILTGLLLLTSASTAALAVEKDPNSCFQARNICIPASASEILGSGINYLGDVNVLTVMCST